MLPSLENHAAAQPPGLRLLCRITARVASPLNIGDAPCGLRRFIPIIGGSVEGSKMRGEVLAGGGDWQTQRADGTLDIRAQYVLRLYDDTLVEVVSQGYRHGRPEVMERLLRGEPVASHEYYFRTAMTFQTASPVWAHLNAVIAIGKAMRQPDAAVLDVFQVE